MKYNNQFKGGIPMKRKLSLLLTFVMLLALVPTVFAGEELKTVRILAAYPTGSIPPEEAQKMAMWADYEKFFAERGLKPELEYVDGDQYTTVLQALIASNDMPDLFCVEGLGPATMLSLAKTGKIFPIDDILEHSDGTAKFALSKEGYMWPCREKDTFEDGKLYYLGQASMLASVVSTHDNFGYNAVTSNTYHIKVRQDWLDKLNMEVPTTLDEFFDMLVAFQENDVNGNGLKDERMVISTNTCNTTWGGFFDNGVAGWFGLANYVFQLDRINWQAKVPFLQEGFVPYIEFLKKCVDAGVLHLSDGITKSGTDVAGLMAQDVIAAYLWRADTDAAGKPEGALYTTLGKIVGVEGIEPVMDGSRGWKSWSAYGFRAGMDPKTAAAMLDTICSIEWSIFFNFGVEGKSYKILDSGLYEFIAPSNIEEAKAYGYTTGYNLLGDGRIPRTAMNAYFQNFNGEKLIWNSYDEFLTSDYFKEFYGPALDEHKIANLKTWASQAEVLQKYNMNGDLTMVAPMVTAEEAEILDMYQTDLYTYMDELFANLISGVYSTDDYQTYVEELYTYGLQEVLDVQQARYDRIVR
ncbi:MAG: hypothetical protein ACOX55_11390 [Christensenellales bacterium]